MPCSIFMPLFGQAISGLSKKLCSLGCVVFPIDYV